MGSVNTSRPLRVEATMGCCVSVESGTVGIKTQCGAFSEVVEPGCVFLCCPGCYESLVGTLSMRVQQHDILCNTKTLDNVFVTVRVSVQYMVKKGLEREAYYRLTNP